MIIERRRVLTADNPLNTPRDGPDDTHYRASYAFEDSCIPNGGSVRMGTSYAKTWIRTGYTRQDTPHGCRIVSQQLGGFGIGAGYTAGMLGQERR